MATAQERCWTSSSPGGSSSGRNGWSSIERRMQRAFDHGGPLVGGLSPDAAASDLADAPLLRACRGLPADRVPVWFMRQAGRSLPEYRALRGTGSILDAIRDPALATEITLQPVRRYGVDAAILYSDIVVPAEAIGFGVDVEPGAGPGRRGAVRAPGRPRPAAALRARRRRPLRRRDGARRAWPSSGGTPLIGFAGAPFTVASYLIEGRPSRTYGRTKAMLHGDPELFADAARPAGRHGHRLAAGPGRRPAPAPSSCSTRGPGRCRRTCTGTT